MNMYESENAPMSLKSNILLLASHDPERDPRCAWIANAAPPGMVIHQLGISRLSGGAPSCVCMPNGGMVWAYPRVEVDSEIGILQQLMGMKRHSTGFAEALSLFRSSSLPSAALARVLGMPQEHPRLQTMRWYLRHIANTTLNLVHHASALRGIDAVIACDLDTLLAGLILKDLYGIPVIYDAHEFWAEADVEQDELERQFWMALEQRLLPGVDYAQTVSASLASIMSEIYGTEFASLPNAEPLSRALPEESLRQPDAPAAEKCRFLFQGGFSKARGIDLLIKAWPGTVAGAVLELRGPDSPYKSEMIALAEATGLSGSRILFPAPVTEDALVGAAAAADVGLIPYTPAGTNYANCCPNKLSQYMAAGLPILANRTAFVASVLSDASCGSTVNFEDSNALVEAVNRLVLDVKARRELGLRAHAYFCSTFHWEKLSQDFYTRLQGLVDDRIPVQLAEGESPAIAFQEEPASQLEEDKSRALVFYGLCPKEMPRDAYYVQQSSLFWCSGRRLWRLLPLRARNYLSPSLKKLLNW